MKNLISLLLFLALGLRAYGAAATTNFLGGVTPVTTLGPTNSLLLNKSAGLTNFGQAQITIPDLVDALRDQTNANWGGPSYAGAGTVINWRVAKAFYLVGCDTNFTDTGFRQDLDLELTFRQTNGGQHLVGWPAGWRAYQATNQLDALNIGTNDAQDTIVKVKYSYGRTNYWINTSDHPFFSQISQMDAVANDSLLLGFGGGGIRALSAAGTTTWKTNGVSVGTKNTFNLIANGPLVLRGTNGASQADLELVFDVNNGDYWEKDDFPGGKANNDGTIGELSWSPGNALGGSGQFANDNDPFHPWFYQLNCNTTSNACASISRGDFIPAMSAAKCGLFLGQLGTWESHWRIRVPQTNGIIFYCGFMIVQTGNLEPAEGIYVRYNTDRNVADTNFVFVAGTGSAYTAGGSGVQATNVLDFKFRCDVAGTILCKINNGTTVTLASHVPTGALAPFCSMGNTNGVAMLCNIDRYSLGIRGLTR